MGSSVLKLKKSDSAVPLLTLLLSAGIFLFAGSPYFAGGKGDRVRVYVDGKEYADFPLNEERDIIISGHAGLNNRLIIKNGEADIVDADCPDKLCVHQKSISKDKETIVCLPNRVVIEIEGRTEGAVDAVSR